MKNHQTNSQSGQIIIIALIFMTIVTTAVVSLVGYAGIQIKGHRQAVAREQALSIAEAGIELAIWKLNNQGGYGGETGSSYANGVYNVNITNLSGSTKLIKVDSFVPNASRPRAHRTVQITATIGGTNIGFNYGVQVGLGGLSMSNSATVEGNVYSDGDIIGLNTSTITGTAIAAGDGTIDGMIIQGNALAHYIEDTDITGDATAVSLINTDVGGNVITDSMSDCTVAGEAAYDTKSSCTVTGTETTPNPTIFSDPPSVPLPITDDQINAWEAEAENGGIIGSQTVSTTVSLGPKKIVGDLTVITGGILNLTGTLWVTGTVNLVGSGIVRVDSTFGSQSGILIAGVEGSTMAGAINILNSAQALGSGTAGSYLMLLSQMTGTTSSAISTSNNSTLGILYAGTGKISISNNPIIKEVTANLLELTNSAHIVYESGLASSLFSSGPGGGWEVTDQTWQLLQ